MELIKTTKQTIGDVSEVLCPYCDELNGKGKSMLHFSHLKKHGKKLIDVKQEFPDHITMTLTYYQRSSEHNKRAGQISAQSAMDDKTVTCMYCEKEEIIVKKNWSNKQACPLCLSKGFENPDGRTKQSANDNRSKTLQRKYGVDNAANIDGVTEKKANTNLERYGGTGFASEELSAKTRIRIEEIYGVRNIMKDKTIAKKVTDVVNSNPERAKKISDALKGIPSKLKDRSYDNIHGNEKAEKLKEDKRSLFRNRFIKNEFPKLLDYFGFEFLDEIYKGAHIFHNFKCKKCGLVMNRQWNSIQQNFRCTTCYPRNNGTSVGEKELLDFIKILIPNTEIIENSRNIIPPKEIDIYIPGLNLGIEYNGLYWHSDQAPNETDPKYHLNKTNECNEKGIRLIHIFEDEWVYKKDIVKNRLIQILGVSKSVRIHARKCIIKEIDSKEKNIFLEKYHIQGSDLSSIKLGAFYNNKLISVMTFSKGNPAKGVKYRKKGVWELNRFCTDYNYKVPGIASKLLSFFKKNFDWIEIYSYADRRWSVGNLYDILGFTLINQKPQLNYWYIKNMKRIHRFALRKKPNEPKNVSEKTLRLLEGYNIIWDCGSLKYSLKNK